MISVIIPVLNEEDNIGKIIKSVRSAAVPQNESVEIIISDGGSKDRTVEIAQDLGVRTVDSEKGRGTQINNGIHAADGDIILVLHADTEIEEDIFIKIKEKTDEGALWGCCRIRMDSDRKIYRAGEFISNLRARNGICFGDQGMFFTRSHFIKSGGFPELPLMEDYEYSLRMKRLEIKPVIADTYLTASVRRFEKYGPLRTGLRMYYLRHLYRKGTDVGKIGSMYDKKRKDAVIVFVKIPFKGFSKTRLKGSDIDALKLSELYLEDVLEIAGPTDWDRYACVTPVGLSYRLGIPEAQIFPQEGMDLGERMSNAFERVFASGYERAVLIGTDIPYAEKGHIEKAIKDLDSTDIVIGPVTDGGYWLIGMKEPHPELFDMEYSHDRVFDDTKKRAEDMGLKVSLLEKLSDTDTPEDIVRIRETFNESAISYGHRALRYIARGSGDRDDRENR